MRANLVQTYPSQIPAGCSVTTTPLGGLLVAHQESLEFCMCEWWWRIQVSRGHWQGHPVDDCFESNELASAPAWLRAETHAAAGELDAFKNIVTVDAEARDHILKLRHFARPVFPVHALRLDECFQFAIESRLS